MKNLILHGLIEAVALIALLGSIFILLTILGELAYG